MHDKTVQCVQGSFVILIRTCVTVGLTCAPPSYGMILSLTYNGRELDASVSHTYTLSLSGTSVMECQAVGNYAVWEYSQDGFVYSTTLPRIAQRQMWTSSLRRNLTGGYLHLKLSFSSPELWRENNPYHCIRCKAAGLPPFSHMTVSSPICFQPG